jgi:hypothetical protein
LRLNAYEGLVITETSQPSPDEGLVVCFRNEAVFGRNIRSANGVTAHLRFFDAERREIGIGVSGVVWLNNRHLVMNLGADESACVVVAHAAHDRRVYVHWKERRAADLGAYIIQDREGMLDVDPEFVQIRLTGARGELLLPPVTIDTNTLERVDW